MQARKDINSVHVRRSKAKMHKKEQQIFMTSKVKVQFPHLTYFEKQEIIITVLSKRNKPSEMDSSPL